MAKNIYERNYDKLQKIIPQLFDGTADTMKLKSDGFMDLTVERLYFDKENREVVSLTHYYEQNGDLMKDPDMEIRVDHKLKTTEALTFQQDVFPQIYSEVYPDENHVNPKLKKSLNSFLGQWLTNIINQGHEPYMINGKQIQNGLVEESSHNKLKQDRQLTDMDMTI